MNREYGLLDYIYRDSQGYIYSETLYNTGAKSSYVKSYDALYGNGSDKYSVGVKSRDLGDTHD
jgi:hypothetical protein